MSWESAITGTDVSLRASPVESRRFGLTISRADVPLAVTDPDPVETVLGLLTDDASDVVVLRYPASRVDWFARLLAPDRVLISADVLTYWQLAVGEGRAPEPDPSLVARPAHGIEPELVEGLVTDIFRSYGSHYLADPVLDPDAALDGYVEWAQHSASEVPSVVLEEAGTGVIGLATLAHSAGTTEILLAGIIRDAQGQHRYAHLLAGAEQAARDREAERLVISTQAHNAGVQRAWARFGFEPVGSVHTVHAVRKDLLGGRS